MISGSAQSAVNTPADHFTIDPVGGGTIMPQNPIPAHPHMQDLTGKRFGRLVVLGHSHRIKKSHYWHCCCDCGGERIVLGDSLKYGRTKSCGCLRRDTGLRPSGDKHRLWRGDLASQHAKRTRAQRLYRLGKCQRCGKPATERHHKDDNPGNNEASNVERLCRRCHMVADGRLERLIAKAKEPRKQPPKPCVSCERLSKPLRRGLCSRCYDNLRR